jgi:hypothetical protein
MEKLRNIEWQIGLIKSIRYRNPEGGPYAFLQFMAYVRVLSGLLRSAGWADRELDRLEATSWMFNEYLGSRFTHAQEIIFENEMLEVMPLLDAIAGTVKGMRHESVLPGVEEPQHELAA